MNLDAILQRCLQQIEAGESIDACLARYPDRAAELAPILAVAVQVRAHAGASLTETQRFQAKAALRQALAAKAHIPQKKSRTDWMAPLGGVRRLAAIAAIALLLVIVLSAGVVASSEPGNPAYAVRVIAERAPALVNPNSAARTAAELTVADRRLAELQSHLERAGRLEQAALRALLAGDEAAARQAARAGQAERLQVARRLATHARLLSALADQSQEPRTVQLLNEAARRTLALVARLRTAPSRQSSGILLPTDDMPAAGRLPAVQPIDTATPTNTPTADLPATSTPTATMTATASPTASSTPVPATGKPATNVAGPDETPQPESLAGPTQVETSVPPRPPRPRQTAFAQTATARAEHATARAATATARASRTPGPGPRQTAMAMTATAHAVTATARASRTPGPGPRQTAMAQTATAHAATATARASRTPGPGPRQTAMALTATALAQTATPEPSATPMPDPPVATPTEQAFKPTPTATRAPILPPQNWRPQRTR